MPNTLTPDDTNKQGFCTSWVASNQAHQTERTNEHTKCCHLRNKRTSRKKSMNHYTQFEFAHLTSAMSYTFWGFLIMSPGSGSRVLVLSAMRPFTCAGKNRDVVSESGTGSKISRPYYRSVAAPAANRFEPCSETCVLWRV